MSSISKYCDRVVLLNQGVKLGEGKPKEMIDIYKQVLVGQYDPNAADEKKEGEKRETSGGGVAENPDKLEYGSGKARIVSYDILDSSGKVNSTILKGSECTFRMSVEFLEDVKAPIFAFTIKNKYGVEITGTNTMFEKAFLEPVAKGQVKTISFRQRVDLQGGEYLLSLGVTGYEGENFTVYHRLYDVMNMTVVSDKNTVGYYDMNSTIQVTDGRME